MRRENGPRSGKDDAERSAARLAQRLVETLCRLSPAARSYRRDDEDLVAWGTRLLPAYFREPPSAMHRWLAAELDRMRSERGSRLNLLAPRGSAKSTVGALAYVLRCAVEGSEPYVWIVSATKDQSRAHLENVKDELAHNMALAQSYPQATGRGSTWRAGAIELVNGAAIESFGVGQQLRGRRRQASRPSLVLCDDLENDHRVSSPQQRAELRDWFHGVVMKAGDERTNVVNLATALHRDSLAMRLAAAPGWTSRTFKSIERWPDQMELWSRWEELYCDRSDGRGTERARRFFEDHAAAMTAGAELLWPEKEGLYSLMRMRVEEGRATFDREKQNSPIDPERCEWPGEYFEDHIWFSQWPADVAVRVVALDPSKGADARFGDYSAYAAVAVDARGIVFVEAEMARRPTAEMVAAGANLCSRFRPDAFGVEANQFQDLLAGEFAAEFRRRRQRVLRPCLVHNHVTKAVRIRRIGPYLAQRRIRFLARSAATLMLVDQLRDFPLGDHDDGPDALEMALRLAEEMLGASNRDDGLGDRLIAA